MSTTFVAPTSVDAVLTALANGARAVAGGTDLVVGARQGKAPLPESLVAIHRVDALRSLRIDATGASLGALVTHERIAGDASIAMSYTALADASSIVGSHATRAHGTIGGNVMNASPAMETGGPLMCLDAQVVLQSVAGTRTLAVGELFVGPGRTVARADELLVAVEIPAPKPGTGSCYARLEYRKQMEIAVVGATAVCTVVDGVITAACVAMTALSATIRRVPAAEAALVGQPAGRVAAESAASAFAAAAEPISDVRASAAYRRAMAAVIARRTIEAALARAVGQHIPIPASLSLHGAL
jgi:CO/xanthine dehydrogenase FAD-binding subunit